MGWKNWPDWLKGGIILLLYSLIFSSFMLDSLGMGLSNLPGIFKIIILILSLPSWIYGVWLCGIGGLSKGILVCNTSTIWLFIYSMPLFILFFIFGSFLGWLYGKIKTRREAK